VKFVRVRLCLFSCSSSLECPSRSTTNDTERLFAGRTAFTLFDGILLRSTVDQRLNEERREEMIRKNIRIDIRTSIESIYRHCQLFNTKSSSTSSTNEHAQLLSLFVRCRRATREIFISLDQSTNSFAFIRSLVNARHVRSTTLKNVATTIDCSSHHPTRTNAHRFVDVDGEE
jgi:hypothetical protein